MRILAVTGGVRLLAVLTASLALGACEPAAPPAAEAPPEAVVLPDKVPVTTQSEAARALYEQGLNLADNLNFLEANEAFAKAVELDPDFALGYLRLAQSAQSVTAFFKAVGQAEDTMEFASEGEQLYIRALIAAAENDQAMQLEYLQRLMSLYPRDERTHMQLGNYFVGQQNFADAISHFRHATELNPQYAAAFNMLGYAERNNGNLAAAREAFARYVELLPDEANPYDSYAELLLESGEYEAAIENYRKALAINPNFLSAYAGITVAESLRGNAAAAIAVAGEMLSAARTPGQKQNALFRAMTSHLFAGDRDAALAVAAKRIAAAEADGNHAALAGIYQYMGSIEAVAGNGAAAMRHYESARQQARKSDLNEANKAQAERAFLFNAAIAAMVDGDHATLESRAAEYAAAAESGGTAFERLRVHELAGYIAAVNGDLGTSAAELAKANQLDPIVLYYEAVANAGMGNREQAASLARRAAYRNTLSPNLPFFRREALHLLAELEAGAPPTE